MLVCRFRPTSLFFLYPSPTPTLDLFFQIHRLALTFQNDAANKAIVNEAQIGQPRLLTT